MTEPDASLERTAAMFEATLYAADPDRQRQQRLLLAAAIAVTSTTTMFAGLWTLERFGVDRVIGPNQHFELLHFDMLTPPKPIVSPPPPPEGDADKSIEAASVVSSAKNDTLEEDEPLEQDEPTSKALTQPQRSSSIPGGPSIPGIGGCPGGSCGGGPISFGEQGKPCTGPLCSGTTSSAKANPPPREVEFSALRCLACADPDQAALRKTVAAGQQRSGRVELKFCVDTNGRVEGNSIEVGRSFGLPAVDRITTNTIKRWRFSPLEVGGKPRRACSRAVFDIRFE